MHLTSATYERVTKDELSLHATGAAIRINPSRDNEYHTQRNNVVVPHAACNVESYMMAAKQAGCSVPSPDGVQPGDHMMRRLRSKEAYDIMRRSYRWAFDDETGRVINHPNEIHEMLVWAFNAMSPDGRATFTERGSIREMVYHIATGNGVVISGRFTLSTGRTLGHVVALAGFVTTQRDIASVRGPDAVDMRQLSALIIDDPYGDYRSDYRDHRGNNIEMSLDDFNRIMRKQGAADKWMHVIAGYDAILKPGAKFETRSDTGRRTRSRSKAVSPPPTYLGRSEGV